MIDLFAELSEFDQQKEKLYCQLEANKQFGYVYIFLFHQALYERMNSSVKNFIENSYSLKLICSDLS